MIYLRVGYELIYSFPQDTPVILNLNIHESRACDLVRPAYMIVEPDAPMASHRDCFGNWATRVTARAGRNRFSSDSVLRDSGLPDPVVPEAGQHVIQDLPAEALPFLQGSRYCETDRLTEIAWSRFSTTPLGWYRVQAICDFVHRHISFGYQYANAMKTAWDVYHDPRGVCRDYAHLAVALCRCMNIPARYCSGYLGDMGTPPPYATMDLASWLEVYLGGNWHTFDPRNNVPRIGRVLLARGRDAADVPLTMTFGPNTLESLRVWTDEVAGPPAWTQAA